MADRGPLREGQHTFETIVLSKKYQDSDNASVKSENIIGQVTSVDLTESIFNGVMALQIGMVDAVDLIGTFPILGEETILLRFNSAGAEPVEMIFDVVAVTDLKVNNLGTTQTYTLTCVSQAYSKNALISIDGVLSGLVSEGIKSVLERHEFRIHQIDPTQGNQEFVIPGLSPYDTVNLLRKHAYHAANPYQVFYFYETLDGLNFRDVSKLIAAEPVAKYAYSLGQSALHFGPRQDGFISALKVDISARIDSTRYTQDGTLGAKVREINYYTKEIKDYGSSYTDQLEKIKKAVKRPSTAPSIQSKTYIEKVSVNPSTYLVNRNHIDRLDSISTVPKLSSSKFLGHLVGALQVPGNSAIRAGDTIIVKYPRVVSKGTARIEDKQVSGKYLISSVSHSINLNKYETTIEIINDSFTEDLHND